MACSIRYNCLRLSIVVLRYISVTNLSFLNRESNKAASKVTSFGTSQY